MKSAVYYRDASETQSLANGIAEIFKGIFLYKIWLPFGWLDIKQRYRRTLFGPFWITLATGFLIVVLGTVWSTLFKQDIAIYIPPFAVGYVLWYFLNANIMESTTLFATYENVIRQTSLPLSIFVMRMIWRNIIFLAHNFVIVIITVCIVWPSWSIQTLWILPGMLVVAVTIFFLSLFVATVCVRYRDIPQVIQSLMQLLFFVTPIMWQRKSLGTHDWIADINPIYHLLELLRAPLLGIAPTQLNFVVGLASAISISLISGYVFAKSMRKIPYWL